MEFRKVLPLRGPNIWANFPVIEAWVDLGPWKDTSSDTVPGFNERLKSWLPGMIEHRCSEGERGGFFERLRLGTYPAHILEHVTLELQALAGSPFGFGRARETSEEGVYRVVFRYREEELAKQCLEAGRLLVLAALQDQPFDVAATVKRLRDLAEDTMLGPSTESIVQAARKRNIPFRRLNEYSLVQLGYGSKRRLIRAAESDQTTAIAEGIAQDKDLTRKLLLASGVPAAVGFPVENAEDAWETANDWVGLPVVVKPRDGNQGRGVTTNITNKEQLLAAYAAALEESSSIIVEKYAPGNDYRLLIIGGTLVAASRREPAQVIGDGSSTIAQLVEVVNSDPRRAEGHSNVLSKIKINDIALNVLKDQGHTPESVPPSGEIVIIRRNANLSTGGTATDVTELVHPEIVARAIVAARVVGLDIAGIDVIATDISKPLEEQGGIIVEVNAAPGLRMHLAPSSGEPRDVGQAIVDMLFAPGENGRIPIAAITGTNGKTTVTRFLAHILGGAGQCVGMSCSDGVYLDGRRITIGDCSGPISAGNLLMSPLVDIGVFETARGGILRAGLAFNECQVAVVTNIGEGDHLGISSTSTLEDLAKVKRCIVDVVAKQTGTAVLNAADELVAGMASYCHGRVLYFALDGANPLITVHRAAGERAIFVRDNHIVLAEGAKEEPLVALDRLPLTGGGRILFEVENALAAIGAAWAMGFPKEHIVERATSFHTGLDETPARFNVLQLRGATVVVDYGHNTHALRAVIQALDTFSPSRRVALFGASGDRRDEDIVTLGRLLGAAFDRVVLYEDSDRYQRKPGETIELLKQGLASGTRVKEIEAREGGLAALEYVLENVQPGELLLAQAHLANPTIEFLKKYLKAT